MTTTTLKPTKRPDGSYEFEGHIIRKATEADVYDPYAERRARYGDLKVGRSIPAAPKPHGWLVEHEDFEHPQAVQTLADGTALANRHLHGHWHARAVAFATALDDAPAAKPDDPEDTDLVLRLIAEMGITYDDFRTLDEKPGYFHINNRGYSSAGSRWHSRLRRTRNSRAEMFDLLAR